MEISFRWKLHHRLPEGAPHDFKADDGTMVDVDFYMKNDDGKLALSDTTVHKVNGKPRFNYQKRGDFWERVKAGS